MNPNQQLTTARLMSRLYPSAVLSEFLNDNTLSSSEGDILAKHKCFSKNVILKPSLYIGKNRWSTKPRGYFHDNNSSITVQMLEDNIWTTEPKFFQKTKLESTMSFVIAGSVYSFTNGTLMNNPEPIQTLYLGTTNFTSDIKNIDFSKTDLLIGENRITTDYLGVLRTLSDYENVRNPAHLTECIENDCVMDLLPLSSVHDSQDSIYNNVVNVFNHLSRLWSAVLVLTVLFIALAVISFKLRKIRKRRATEYRPAEYVPPLE